MVIEVLGVWSSVEKKISTMSADGRIEAVVLQYPGSFGDIFKIYQSTDRNSLRTIKNVAVGFNRYELTSSVIEGKDGKVVHALHIIFS